MALLRDSPNDLVALAGAAADAFRIPQASFVEKDFWAIELLRSVTKPLVLDPINGKPCTARALFKGGTSLSKAFGLIERFSEDIDILVVAEGMGKSALDNRVLRPICERAGVNLGITEHVLAEATTGVKRNVNYAYPQQISSIAITPWVRLEMGVRGGTLPGTATRTVMSFITEYVQQNHIDPGFDELVPVEVEVIAPVRTLAEKLALLHHAGTTALTGETASLEKAGRHFGDIARLLGNADVLSALREDQSTMAVLAADVDEWSERSGWPYTPRATGGYGASPAFDLSSPIRGISERSYVDATALMWGYVPSFAECIEVVVANSELL